jgi:hypothetical protein
VPQNTGAVFPLKRGEISITDNMVPTKNQAKKLSLSTVKQKFKLPAQAARLNQDDMNRQPIQIQDNNPY